MPFSDVLPSILPHLVSSSLDVRLQATKTINAFVWEKINSSFESIKQCIIPISYHVRSFIDAQIAIRKSPRIELALRRTINGALALDIVEHPAQGPFWALNVLACLIVLSDFLLFSHPRSLKLALPSLAQALSHRCSAVRSLQLQVWKCLTWAFLRLPLGREHEDVRSVDSSLDVEHRAFLLVKQETNGGIGATLAMSLLGTHNTTGRIVHPVSKALAVVEDMVGSGTESTQKEGLLLLARFLDATGTSRAETNQGNLSGDIIFSTILFDNTLLHPSWDHVSDAIQSDGQSNMGEMRCLSDQETVQHWDTLISIWIDSARRCLQETNSGFRLPVSVFWFLFLPFIDMKTGSSSSHLAVAPTCRGSIHTGT